jgi:hypothetical protein
MLFVKPNPRAIEKQGAYYARDGYRVRRDFIRDTVWPLVSKYWAGLMDRPEGRIFVPSSTITGEPTIREEQMRLRIEEEYIGIGCQLITKEELVALAQGEGWEFPA